MSIETAHQRKTAVWLRFVLSIGVFSGLELDIAAPAESYRRNG
jgi:hypothetical protein